MTTYELKQAGFSDVEINAWQGNKYSNLKAAGFSDAAIEAKYGPLGVTPPTPKPYDFNFLGTPVTVSHITDALKDYFRPWVSVGFSSAESLNRGLATFSSHLDTLGDLVGKYTGAEKGGLFKEAARTYNENADYWKKRAREVGTGFFQELLGEAVGGAFPGIAEFMLNVPYAAALGAAKADKEGANVLGGALVEGAKRGVLGALFHAMDPLQQYLRAPAMGLTFGVQTATEGGGKEDIAKAVGTGMLYSALSPGGRYGLNEIKENDLDYLKKDFTTAHEIKKTFEPPVIETPPTAAQETATGPITTGPATSGEPATVSTPKVIKPFEAKTLIAWIKSQGGILDETFPGETNRFIDRESGETGLLNKENGKPLDELTALAKDYGWIGKDATSTDFIDLLSKDVQAAEQGKKRIENFNQDIEKGVLSEISKEELAIGQHADELTREGWKVYGPRNQEVVGNIHPGDRLLINGDGFVHVGFDKEGKAIVKDGQMFKVDVFDKTADEAITKGEPPQDAQNQAFNPDKAFRRTPDEMLNDGEPISRSDIAQFLEEKLDIPIRTGKFRDKALGIFKPREEVIRSKYTDDIEVIAHEAGHALQKYLWPESFKKNLVSAPFRAYLDELLPLATSPKSGKPKSPEGFAEFIRLYLTHDAEAQAKAPRFYQYFDGLLEKKSPEVRNILLNARSMYDKFMQQPARARILSQISIGEKESNRWWSFDNLYTKWIDDLHPLEMIVREMSKKDDLKVGDDPYKLARLLKGVTGKVEAFMKNQPFRFGDYKNIEGAKSLKEILDSVRDNLDDFRTYIISKRAIELAKRKIETGLNIDDCRRVAKADDDRFSQAFEDLKAYQDAGLQYLRDSGMLSGEAYLKMKSLNEDYDPFYRLIEDQKGLGTGRGLQATDPLKKIHGGWGAIVDPLESIVKNTFLYISMAEKNAVGQALVKLAEKKEGMGRFVEKVPSPVKGIEVQPEEITKKLKPILDQYGIDIKKIPEELLKGFAIFRPGEYGLKDNVITVFNKGDQEFYEVHPEVARVFQGLDKEAVHSLFKILRYPASWLRAGATLTPEFLGRNPIRDQFAAFVNTKYGIMSPFDFIRGVFHMAKKDTLYWEFKKSGADNSMLVSVDRDYLQDNLGELLQKYPLAKLAKNPFQALRMLSEVGEMATRLGEFERGIKAQEEIGKEAAQEAGFASRELTLDFARAGSIGRSVNQIVAFWNANVQGTDKMIRQFKEDPLGTSAKVAASITLPSVILAAANSDDPRYKDIPQWQKDLFWIIIPNRISQAQWDAMSVEQRARETQWLTGTIWRIPKPFELGILFGTIPERITNWILKKDPKSFDHIFETMARGFSPGAIPTIAAPLMESWANRSLFFDRPIIPRSKEDILPQYQYGNYTSETAKELGKLIGTLPQVGETVAASPAIIENFIRGWTGGLGKYALDIADAGLKAVGVVEEKYEQPSKTLADIPFFKGFVVRYPSANTEAIARFYEAYSKEQKIFKTINYLSKKEGDVEGAVKLYQESGGVRLEGIATSLKTIRQLSDMIIKNPSMSGDEKRQQLDILYLQMTQIADYGNKFMDGMNKTHR